jgi:hypothetical protein
MVFIRTGANDTPTVGKQTIIKSRPNAKIPWHATCMKSSSSAPLRLYQTRVRVQSFFLLFIVLVGRQLQDHIEHCFSGDASIRSQTPQGDFAWGV